jgi:tetratricopeptide (TPR) repeat protein
MAQSSKRLEFLQKMTTSAPGADDPLAWYGLAQEYRSLERFDEALVAFESLRARKPDYVPQYLMCGQMLEKLGRAADARVWLEKGIEAARAKRDTHALGELESALAALA